MSMRIYNQTASAMTIQSVSIPALGSVDGSGNPNNFYNVPVLSQSTWSKDSTLRAGLWLGSCTLSVFDPQGSEFNCYTSTAQEILDRYVNGLITLSLL